jgi:hypothetical protein
VVPAKRKKLDMSPRTEPTEEAVQHWIKQGRSASLRNIRAAMADLWRKEITTLTCTENGDFRGNLTELGESAAKAEEQRDPHVCERCRKSSGDIKKYIVIKHNNRLDEACSMTVKDRIALDLKQIELIIRIEMLEALQRAPPQIAAVLGEDLSQHRPRKNFRLSSGNRAGQRSRWTQ